MNMPILAALVAVFLLLSGAAMADDITVGAPNGGWDLSTDFNSWASSQTFRVGDNLVFAYTPGQHDVLEVTKANYDSCGTSSPISTSRSGNDSISLSTVGTRYFICGIPGHCGEGMKLEVNVVAGQGPSPPVSSGSPPASIGSPPASTGSSPPQTSGSGNGPSNQPPESSSTSGLKAKVAGVVGLVMVAAIAV